MTNPFEVAIERLLPHRGEMRWVERLLDHDEDSVAVEVIVPADAPMSDADGVPAIAGVEYMAQAIAVWAGIRALARGAAARPGFLLGTRRYDCDQPHFRPGQRLRIEARREIFGENGLGMFACRILDESGPIAQANLSVFEPPDEANQTETMNR